MTMLAFIAAFQIMFLTACSVNIPMVSDSADTEGYTDAQTMLIIATERNRYRQVWRSVRTRCRSRRIYWSRYAPF